MGTWLRQGGGYSQASWEEKKKQVLSKPGSAIQMGCTDPAIGYRQIKSAPIGVLGVLAGNTESQVRGQTVGKGIERFK